MITEDVIVYAHPDGLHYVANFTELGWRQWPGIDDGWGQRKGCPATVADQCEEMPPKNARLALQLSGVTL